MEQRPLEYTVKIYCEVLLNGTTLNGCAPSILLLQNIEGKSMGLLSDGQNCKDTL